MPDGDRDRDGDNDTIEIQRDPSLADDLLRHGSADGSALAESEPVDSIAVGSKAVDLGASGSGPRWVEPVEDDEDYYEPPKKRSRVTTGLVIALIFLLGMFVGVSVSRLLPSQQRPQVVYLLNDDGGAPQAPSGMPSTFPSGMPSGSPAGGPPGAPSGR